MTVFISQKKLLLKYLTAASVVAVIFFGCKKDKDVATPSTPPPVVPPANPPANTIDNFTMFHAGNYWVYENYTIDSNGVETLQPGTDSAFYKGDTLINGDTCHIVHFWWILLSDYYLKDSSGYLIMYDLPVFSTAVTNDTFYAYTDNDTTSFPHAREDYRRVDSLTSSATVPAGTFSNVLEVTETMFLNPYTIAIYNPVIQRTRYAKNIGKISEQYSFYGELHTLHMRRERRLVRYHVN